jgi:hypothetical protein
MRVTEKHPLNSPINFLFIGFFLSYSTPFPFTLLMRFAPGS